MSAADNPSVWFFSVHAAPEPSVMPRILELFAKRGLVPHRLHASVAGPVLAMDVQVCGLNPVQADHAAASMRNIVGVERVLASAMAEAGEAAR